MKINKNLCMLDRALRITGSAMLIYVGFFNTDIISNIVVNTLLGSFGVFNIFVALVGFCPVYHLAHISTYPKYN